MSVRPAVIGGRTFDQTGNRKSERLMAGTGWKRPFEEPIPLPRGRQLVTLEDARRRSPCRTRLFVCLVCRSCPTCRGSGVTDLKSLRIVLRHRDMSQSVVCRSELGSSEIRNGGRLLVGTPGRIKSESATNLRITLPIPFGIGRLPTYN